jgi:hypothetical protein
MKQSSVACPLTKRSLNDKYIFDSKYLTISQVEMTSELRALLVVLIPANVALRKKEIFERGREKKRETERERQADRWRKIDT